MLRFIRFAALVGMLLALAEFCLAFRGIGHNFSDFRHEHTLKALAEAIQQSISKLYSSSIWFAYGGVLYLLAGMASRQLQQAAAKKEESEILNSDRCTTETTVHSRAG